jgi:asparagine N-glycosylation enzyme membrane subunit Stt3
MGRFYHRLRAARPSYTHDTMSYAFKLGGVAIAFLLIGVLGIVIFDRIWFRVGLGAALLVVFGGLLLLAWNVDRKDKAKRAGLDELPRI